MPPAPSEQVALLVQSLSLQALRAAYETEERRLQKVAFRSNSRNGLSYFYMPGMFAFGWSADEIRPAVDALNSAQPVLARRQALEAEGIFARVVCYDEPGRSHGALFVEYDERGARVLKGN